MTKPTVLQIGPQPPGGFGIASYLDGLLRSEISSKYQVLFLDTKGSKVWRVNILFRCCLTIWHIAQLIFRLVNKRPAIAHIHTSSGTSFIEKSILSMICHSFGVRTVIHLHSGDFVNYCFQAWNKFWVPKILELMDSVVWVSNTMYNQYKSVIPAKNMRTIPNALMVDDFTFSSDRYESSEKVNLLYVGAVNKRKGLVDLAWALKKLISQGMETFRLDVVGEEKKTGECEIETKFKSMGLEKFVQFHGLKTGKEKIKFFWKADIFILPSHSESFGISNLEAMASGLPVVSTRVGAIPEYLVNGENGFLFEPGDSDELSDVLHNIILNPELRIKMGENNRKKVLKHYDWSVVSGEIDRLYQSILKPEKVNTKDTKHTK